MCCRQCFRSNAKEIGFIKVAIIFSVLSLILHVLTFGNGRQKYDQLKKNK
ncbi:hypothetical protein CFP56_013484 [Quercus suber]|uniref:Uncharacterized protein n=1 Tax=Quercus suber TaxID=58331 RepID=A0AAW0KU70_QUESU